MTNEMGQKSRNFAFSTYLRTGRLVAVSTADRIEAKFNPWHDADDGRFTYAGVGRYFAPGSAGLNGYGFAKPPSREQAERISPEPTVAARRRLEWERKLSDPKNFSAYVVKPGDSLSRIAAMRRGLRISDLAALNGIGEQATLLPGQRLRIPNQDLLEENRKRRANDLAIGLYAATHGGKFPPDPDNVPSIQQQIDTVDTVVLNNYRYQSDLLSRPRDIQGALRMDVVERRSRSVQANAGGKDRLPTDDGGHYVATRFGGAPHPLNHFAQDSNFNRGRYRAMEDDWARAHRAGRRVFIHIVPKYHEISLRPYELDVIWYVDGKRYSQKFKNERREK